MEPTAAQPPRRQETANSYLNLTRGLAALAVFAGHLRSFVFVEYADLPSPALAWKAFYFVTGFGHQAVMVFFVLSGFLIGGQVAGDVKAGRWSWPRYAAKRLSRLWIVLIPALLLTALCDRLGMALTHSPFYSGALYTTYYSGPAPDPASFPYGFATFGWNAVFQQTILAPPFGSNGPLWSLANEFWYYVLFPLAWVPLFSAMSTARRLVSASAVVLLCLWLPNGILAGGLIWLFGFVCYLASGRIDLMGPRIRVLAAVAAFATLAGVLSLSRFNLLGDFGDLAIGATFALLLLPLTRMQIGSPGLRRLSQKLAGMSYTLYLVHFPIAAFVAGWALRNERFAPGLEAGVIYAATFAGVFACAWAFYLLFEKRTPALQKWLLARFARP